MAANNPSGSQGGSGGSSKGSGHDAKGKGQEILDGLHPRIETRGQSRRHDKKRDNSKKKGSKKSVDTKDEGAKRDDERAQADSIIAEDVAARVHLPRSEVDAPYDTDEDENLELPGFPEDTEADSRALGVHEPRDREAGPSNDS
jgi:hypothetical protein